MKKNLICISCLILEVFLTNMTIYSQGRSRIDINVKPSNYGTVHGYIRYGNNPIHDATVIVTNEDLGQIYGETLTYFNVNEGDGYFSMAYLPTNQKMYLFAFLDDNKVLFGSTSLFLHENELKKINLQVEVQSNTIGASDPNTANKNPSMASPLSLLTIVTRILLAIENNQIREEQIDIRNRLEALRSILRNGGNAVEPKTNLSISKKIEIKGGGGDATYTKLRFSLSCEGAIVKGTGYSDASDAIVRVGLSLNEVDDSQYIRIENRQWINLNLQNVRMFYVVLNSKWGSEPDSYLELELVVPKNCEITYENVDKNQDDLEYVRIQ